MQRAFFLILAVLMLILLSCQSVVKNDTESRIAQLISQMTLQEKIGQLQQSTFWNSSEIDDWKRRVREGRVGSFLNIDGVETKNSLQKMAMQESRLKIPIIFGRDVIHGFRTVFPIPLGQAASWNPGLVEQAVRVAAIEASSTGIRWTFAPMLDIARDPRWGRIAEGCGEDPYLTSQFAAAMVQGFQGDNLADPQSIAACAKHYVGYGAAEGGRDYNTTWIPENLLREVYLPSFKAAKDAGAATYMSAFNEINGAPASGNEFTLRQVLRKEWQFDGFVVSDWGSIEEMIQHGYCADKKEAALKGLKGGVDMEMVSNCYAENLETLVKEGQIAEALIDESVANILRVKFRLGLFDRPYTDPKAQSVILAKEHLQTARELTKQSIVLLKNERNTLPLSGNIKNLAVIGPLADNGRDQLGCWIPDGRGEESITPLKALREFAGNKINILYAEGLETCRSMETKGFNEAVQAARKSDAVLLFVGEDANISGEARSRAFLNLPGLQEQLVEAIAAAGKPLVMIIMAGRPLIFNNLTPKVHSILYAWHPGTMGGPALSDIIFGLESPSAKLPLTFVSAVGQIPTYYAHKNTGRPPSPNTLGIPLGTPLDPSDFTSRYIDADYLPEYPFGFGLSYTTFEYKNLKLSSDKLQHGETLQVTAKVTNTGALAADEIAQLYTRDLSGSMTRPVKELKGFRRIHLNPGETKTVTFDLTAKDLAFYNAKMQLVTEPGKFHVWIGWNSDQGLQGEFAVVGK